MQYTLKNLFTSLAALLITAGGSQAAIVLSDNFEAPTAAGYQITNTERAASSLWVRANQGFGADRNGTVGEGVTSITNIMEGGVQVGTNNFSETFSDPDADHNQAYAFRYTNSGLTSAAGTIGTLSSGQTITVTLKIARDNFSNEQVYTDGSGRDNTTFANATAYNIALVTFLADGSTLRNDIREDNGLGDSPSSTLATLTGDLVDDLDPAAVDDSWYTYSFSYTVTGSETALGDDIALRVYGSTDHALIDDVSIDVTAIPEPATALLGGLGLLALLRRRR